MLAPIAVCAAAEPEIAAGTLGEVAVAITARTGALATFEGTPRALEGVEVQTERDPYGDGYRQRFLFPDFRFSYSAGATPDEIAEAAVAAWNKQPTVPLYEVVTLGTVVNFVPLEIPTAGGGHVAYRALLDTEIQLASPRGQPTDLYHEILRQLRAATGVEVEDGIRGLLLGSKIPEERMLSERDGWFRKQDDVVLPTARGTARELLDLVMIAAGRQTNWQLAWVLGSTDGDEVVAPRWVIGFMITSPEGR